MLVKQLVIIGILIPFIEYYNYIAVRKASKNRSAQQRKMILVFYAIFSVLVLAGLIIYPRLATTHWPWQILKVFVSLLIAAFFGKLLISILMLIWDILLALRWVAVTLHQKLRQVISPLPKPKQGMIQKTQNTESRQNLMTRSEFVSKGALLCGAALTMGLSYGMTNKYRFRLRYIPLTIPGLPEDLRGFRMVQISDVHSGSFDNRDAVYHGIRMVLNASPHIVLFTGDLVNYRADEIVPYMDMFSKITAPLGVYSILGNHDYSDYIQWDDEEDKKADFEQLLAFQKEMGWNLMMNSHVILPWKGKDFALIGSENWSIKSRFPKYGNMENAVAGLDTAKVSLKILMSHDPSHWDAEIRPKYPDIDLTLSGHTHGMQLGVETAGLKWSPSQYLYRQWAGLYKEGQQYLYVNRGFGFIGYNGRLGIMPEITLLELV